MSKGVNEEEVDLDEDDDFEPIQKTTYSKQKPNIESQILNYLKKHKGVKYATNPLQRAVFGRAGGGYSAVLLRLAEKKTIKSEKCICGKGVLYWLDK